MSAPVLRRFAVVGVAVVVVVAVQWWLDSNPRLFDVTAGDSLSLTTETREVLDAVDDRLEITAFIGADQPGRVEARALLDRYERANRTIRARIVDPLTNPGEVRRLGVDPTFGGVALQLGDRIERVTAAIEQDLTLGIARLVRGDLPPVCLSTGHGELDPESRTTTGFSSAAGLLTGNGYELRAIDLLSRPEVPDTCAAVIVAFPTGELGSSARGAVAEFVDEHGRLLLLAEPGFPTGLEDLVAGYGIDVLGGTVVEGDPAARFGDDATAPIVSRYSSANPVVRNLAPTFFVTVGGIETADLDVPGLTTNRLADTSPGSLLVEDVRADETEAVPGPITVAAAADRSANVDGVVQRSRVVVVADGDVASNAFVAEAANGRFLVQAVDWLTVDDSLVSVPSNLAAPRPLELTAARRSYARWLTAGIVPALFLIAGGMVWAARRSR